MRMIRQIILVVACASISWAQFSSGSTGADGAYNPTVSGDFDPVALGLNPAGDNVFNFTTINIPSGVTIKLRASKLRNQAVTWLASGNVTIAGTLDLSGQLGPTLNSDNQALLVSTRLVTEPGPGGYPGGLGSRGGVGPLPGAGPGGGPAGLQVNANGNCNGAEGSFITPGATNARAAVGQTYGTYLLIPLYGGSGGGGGWDATTGNNVGGIGGAGGGAIRIVSTTQISVTGLINANGGNRGFVSGSLAGCAGGGGSGGAVHLVAPTIAGSGTISVQNVSFGNNQNGITRFSTNTNSSSINAGNLVVGPLFLPPSNSTLVIPSLSITQVNGVNVPAAPTGSYLNPDVVIAASTPVSVNIAAKNIPLGTVVSLRLTSETGGDQNITAPNCTGLAGTVDASTASCTATFPFSVSIASIRANW